MKNSEKLKIFMIMPFEENLTTIYNEHIKKPLVEKGYRVSRADDIFRPTPILNDILNSIKTSDIIIADMTYRNPNVFYELGVAHSYKKYVIQICQKEQDIPFDLRLIRTILYTDNLEGFKSLTKQIIKFVLTFQKEKVLNEMIEIYRNSDSYYESGENAEFMLEIASDYTPKQIIEIAVATIDNRQNYESDNTRLLLEVFFKHNLDILPKYIIRQLEYNGNNL